MSIAAGTSDKMPVPPSKRWSATAGKDWNEGFRKFVAFLRTSAILLLQLGVVALAVVMTAPADFGILNAHFAKNVRQDLLGPAYFEAKTKVLAVNNAKTFEDLKNRATELVVWSQEKGLAYLILEQGDREAEYALRHVKKTVTEALNVGLDEEADREDVIWEIKRGASEVPLEAFYRNGTGQTAIEILWALAFVLAFAVSAGTFGFLQALLKGSDRISTKGRIFLWGLGGAIGGGAYAILAFAILYPSYFLP